MKVWVLSHGCRFEGGAVVAIYRTELIGLRAAEKYMQESIARTASHSKPNDSCQTYFVKQPLLGNGDHYWIEHYCWQSMDGSMVDGDSDFLSLACYELL